MRRTASEEVQLVGMAAAAVTAAAAAAPSTARDMTPVHVKMVSHDIYSISGIRSSFQCGSCTGF